MRGADGVLVAGSPRSPDEAGTVVGLHAFGRQVGTLSFWAPGRELSLREHRLIGDVSRHLGSALHALALRDEVQRARERLVLAREEERRRLRRDLHDGIGPTLAGLTLKARTAQALLPEGAERAAAQLHEIGEEIRRTVTEVRRAVEGLRPPALDELGLAAACTQGLQRIAAGAALHLTVCGGDELPPLPAAVEVAAYRIVFEAVTNVVRHAQASACGVSFTAEPDALILQVTDDGTGLSGDGGGTGMASMSERARELGGDLEISSAAGVTVRARLPLSATRSLS